eukprot:364447-Chlamydomonas_euryale.AAC.22
MAEHAMSLSVAARRRPPRVHLGGSGSCRRSALRWCNKSEGPFEDSVVEAHARSVVPTGASLAKRPNRDDTSPVATRPATVTYRGAGKKTRRLLRAQGISDFPCWA